MTSNDISLEILQQLNQEFAIKEADFYSTIKNLHQHEDQLNAEMESLKVELIGRNENTQTKIAEITHLQSLIAELEQEKIAFQNTYNEQLNVYRESMNEYKEELEAQINTIGTELKTQRELSTEYLTALGEREKEFASELAKLRESGELQRQSIEIQHKEVIAELSNEYKTRESNLASQIETIRNELKTQSELSTEYLTALGEREKEFASEFKQVVTEKYTVELKNSDLFHLLTAAQLLESQLHSELAMRQQILSDLSIELKKLQGSFTWRITAPLRAVAKLFIFSHSDSKEVLISSVKTSSIETNLVIADSSVNAIIEESKITHSDHPIIYIKETFMSSSPIVAATSLDELLAYHDADFIHCAYITLLGRAPDPEGIRYYLGRIRAGRAKIEIIDQIASSAEAKSRNQKIVGLKRAIKIYRIQKTPIIGNILVLFFGYSSKSMLEQKLSVIENQIYRNNQDSLKKLDWLDKNLISLRKDIKNIINTADIIHTNSAFEDNKLTGITYIDITTLMKWNRPPVGIIRVLLEIVKYSLNDLFTKYFCFNSTKDDMKIIEREIILELVERLSNLHHRENQTDNNQYFEEIRMLLEFSSQTEVGADDFLPFHDGQLSSLFGSEVLIAKNMNSFFESQDTIVSVGLDWDSSNYPILHWLKKRIGFTFVGAFYDGIPVVAPHLVQSYGFSQMFFQHIYNLIHLSDKIFSISHFSENQLRGIIDDHQIEKIPDIATIYLGNSEEKSLFVEDNYSYKSREHATRYAIYVSTIETRKNHKLLLEVWKRMIDLKIPNIPDLVCVGMWGWGIEELRERYFNDKDLQKYIHFYDNVNDEELSHLYKHAMFSLFPSFMEGWGLGAVESMTYGVPSIISTAPALIEATQNLMPTADPEDPEAWIIEISKILNEPEYLLSLGMSIKESFERKTWTKFSKEFYSFVLEKK